MKQNSSIYILALSPVFNKELVPNFETFDKEHSSYLYSTLVFNNKEIMDKLSESANIVFCFDSNDQGLLEERFSNAEYFFLNRNSGPVLRTLSEKYFSKYNNNLIIFSNSIGFSSEDIAKVFNLLSMEDESFVIGKSTNQSLSFFGFNSFNMEQMNDLELADLNYDSFLNKISRQEHFIHVLDNFLLIKNVNDFKLLYQNLSNKESFSYCSQNIHERFTNLFIEYKDLLK